MELLNGEIRDEEKVMRGLKKDDTGLIHGIRVYNNFTKKHIGLNGKTSAEAALILVESKNKWTYYHPECLVSTRDLYNLLFFIVSSNTDSMSI